MPLLLIFGFISLIGVVILLALSLLIDFITAPLRTLALVIEKLCGVLSIIFVIIGVIMYFNHPNTFFKEHDTWIFILIVISLSLLAAFSNWFRARPTRAERRAAQQTEEERQRQTNQLAYELHMSEAMLAQQTRRQNSVTLAAHHHTDGQQPTTTDTTLSDEG